jgi:hypothetical protein
VIVDTGLNRVDVDVAGRQDIKEVRAAKSIMQILDLGTPTGREGPFDATTRGPPRLPSVARSTAQAVDVDGNLIVCPSAAAGAVEQQRVVSDACPTSQRSQSIVPKRQRSPRDNVIKGLRDVAASEVAFDAEDKVAVLKIVADLAAAKAAPCVKTLRCRPTIASVRADIEAGPSG